MANPVRERLTAKERRIIDSLLDDCLRSKKGIGTICRDDWPHANAMIELGLLEVQDLIDDKAWWLTSSGVDVAYDRTSRIATP